MVYLVHNLRGNILSANGSKDTNMKRDIVLSEIGKLIAVKPDVIIAYLRKVGVKVKGNASTGKLVKLVSEAIPKSKNFTFLLAEEIDGKGRAKGFINGDTSNPEINWAGAEASTTALAAMMVELFGQGKAKPKAKGQLQSHTNTIKGIADGGTGSGSLIRWGIGISAVVGLIFGIKAITK